MLLSLGVMCLKLWLGKADYDSGIIPLAVLYRNSTVSFYNLHFKFFSTDGLAGVERIQLIFYCILSLIPFSQFLKGDSVDVITVYGLQFSSGEFALSLDSGLQNISLEGVQFLGSLVTQTIMSFFFCS